MPEVAQAMPVSRSASLSIDTKNEELLASVAVGDDVTFEVSGKVTGVQAPRKEQFGDEPEIFPGHVSLDISGVKKMSGTSKEIKELDMMFTDEEES